MIINLTSIAILPFLFLAWALNSYLFLMSVRLLLSKVIRVRSSDLYLAIQRIADTAPRRMDTLLDRWLDDHPRWLAWVCVMLGVALCEQILLWIAVSFG